MNIAVDSYICKCVRVYCHAMSILLHYMPFLVAVNNCNFTVNKSSFCSVVTSNFSFFFLLWLQKRNANAHRHIHIRNAKLFIHAKYCIFVQVNKWEIHLMVPFGEGGISKFMHVIRFCNCAFSIFFVSYHSLFAIGWLPIIINLSTTHFLATTWIN